ncbi:Cutaneous T-cell lymphoma-associated antigen 5 [Cricetulus griseus]|uniref:Cutaneous T-cell lymphoma-associated antigen 5 n=1 Tax=Cricetulus griseus TaxID=10029 RepID=G3I7N6_CRIGR|nr:Cutaneous T-cell lymphoma-associated antigen 5 [Cricetulus griseus]
MLGPWTAVVCVQWILELLKWTTYENLERHKSQLEDEILSLEKKLEEERAKHEQDELLLEEFEKTKEQTDELNNQKAICGRSKVQAEQVLNEKENEIKSLMESLLKTKVWTCLFGDDITDYGNLDLEIKSDLENDVHLRMETGSLFPLHSACLSCSLYT